MTARNVFLRSCNASNVNNENNINTSGASNNNNSSNTNAFMPDNAYSKMQREVSSANPSRNREPSCDALGGGFPARG